MVERFRATHRLAWARLSSDAVFISLFAIFIGVSTLFHRSDDPILGQLDIHRVTVLFMFRQVGLIVGGVLVLASLIRSTISLEVLGRFILIADLLLECWRAAEFIGFDSSRFVEDAITAAIGIFICWLRFTVLLNKEGIVFQIPPRVSPGSSELLRERIHWHNEEQTRLDLDVTDMASILPVEVLPPEKR